MILNNLVIFQRQTLGVKSGAAEVRASCMKSLQ